MTDESDALTSKATTSDATFSDAFDAPDQQGVMGPENGATDRAPAGEGVRAPLDAGKEAQMSVFDGKGNESVVVLAETEDGRPAQGSGPDVASALADAKKGKADPAGAND